MTEKGYSDNGKVRNPSASSESTTLKQEIQRTIKNDELKLIDELSAAATPRQIRTWITLLEENFAKKKEHARSGLQGKVKDIVESNGYSLEELFGARILPTTDELAEMVKAQES